MNRQTNMNEARLTEENERWETHWVFIRSWLKSQVSVDNTVSTKHTIPVYAKVLRVMDELRPPTEGDEQ